MGFLSNDVTLLVIDGLEDAVFMLLVLLETLEGHLLSYVDRHELSCCDSCLRIDHLDHLVTLVWLFL